MSAVKAIQEISETARERETFKYDPNLLQDIVFNDSEKPVDSSRLFTAKDAVLTSLAQLGATRTRTSRSLISLFDQNWQYIIAEATQNLPLLPDISQDELEGEHLWLSRTAIPRVHGVCNHTLVGPGSMDDPENEPPLTITDDLTTDPRFCKKPYCMPGSSARFYAAVPIRTPGGINIGVYCVIDEMPRPISSWTEKDTAVLRHLARAIMSHLECRSTKHSQKMGEQMTHGIASFMEAKVEYPIQPIADQRRARFQQKAVARLETPGSLVPGTQRAEGNEARSHMQSDLPSQSSTAYSEELPPSERGQEPQKLPNRRPLRRSAPSFTSDSSTSTEQSADQDSHTLTDRIFSKAASIVRESIESDGMLFISASNIGMSAFARPSHDYPSSSDETAVQSTNDSADGVCPILGSSLLSRSTNRAVANSTSHVKIPPKLLSKLFKRYPTGKILLYDEHGVVQDYESSGDDDSPLLQIPYGVGNASRHASGSTSRSKCTAAQSLSKYFPGARSVVFVPIRDDLKERWFAGGFAYTTSPSRIFTIQGELSYVRAFSTLVMAEVHRMEITLAHKAKSDILNSLSHELRSPLHGVVLSTELLADTQLDAFQGYVLQTLETCGRTLLDTIDHMLDFSKINNYLKSAEAEKHASRGHRGHAATSIDAGMKSLYSNVCLDVLVEEVAESVVAGYHLQHMPVAPLARKDILNANVLSTSHTDFNRPTEDPGLPQDNEGLTQTSARDVSVYLDIDPHVSSFQFSSMAGALRRIVMNLLGNALKYTHSGSIHVSVSIEPETERSAYNDDKMIRFTVTDTGKGMSADFIRNDLYTPFLQADPLSPGTGLGLSLVKKIVTSLRGNISIESQLGMGTVATVLLPLSPLSTTGLADPAQQSEHREIDDYRQRLRGLRIRLAGFETHCANPLKSPVRQPLDAEIPLKMICTEWLQMEPLTFLESNDIAPDVVLCSETSLNGLRQGKSLWNNPPVVVICANALIARDRSLSAAASGGSGTFEFISEPVGPLKLGRTLSHTVTQWVDRHNSFSSREHADCDSVSLRPVCTRRASYAAPSRTPPRERGDALDRSHNVSYSSETSTVPDLESASSQSPSSPPHDTSDPSTPDDELCPPKTQKPPTPNSPGAKRISLSLIEDSNTGSSLTSVTMARQTRDSPEFLLVDDNPINLKILCVYMKKLGCSYATAVDGQDAVDKYKAQAGRFKYILMDISMPRLDGMEATRQIRVFEVQQGLQPATVYALSGLASASVQEEALNSGIDLFLTKPVKMKELGLILSEKGG